MTRPASDSPPGEPGPLAVVLPEPRPPQALYVHVPFCVSLCPYCDFVVVAGAAARGPRNRIGEFVAAVRRELKLRAAALDTRWGGPEGGTRPPLDSLYFGGGTPSLLPAGEIDALVRLVRERYGLAAGAEVTLEANPGPDERGDPAALVAAGITRLSFGAQALDDATLRVLGRRHRARHVATAISSAREAGMPSVSLDLLYDVPGQTIDAWAGTLAAALDLGPDHLSLYALTLDDPDREGLTGATGDHLPVAPGARKWRQKAIRGQDEERAAAMYRHAVHRLAEAGFHGYEISNWARPGHESRHNLAYWERRPYEAAGPGAHAFDGATRRWNAARLDSYMAALTPTDGGPGRLPPGGQEVVDADAAAVEAVILGLRTSRGLPLAASRRPPLAEHFQWALAADLLDLTADDRIVFTTTGRLLSNELFSRLV